MKTTLFIARAGGLGAAILLAACGGGSGDTPSTSNDVVPPSAVTSTQSFVDFQKGLQVDDTIEPLQLQQLLPPKDDTIEPFAIG
jgi:hypothetical protein